MKIQNLFNYIFLCALLVFTACKKDQILDDVVIIDPEPAVIVEGSVSGLVMNTFGEPLADAVVRLGINEVQTDENGVFIFRNMRLNETGELITAQKEGYFYNAKFVRPSLSKISFTKFKMIERTVSGSFMTNNGGTVATNGNAKVTFTSNSIKQENGNLYTGSVNVYATWIDPSGENLLFEMPGDLRAINTDGAQVQLTSYGMIGVELESESGEPLNIADGETATLEFPVPEALRGSAPSSIPLWHFNEMSGNWEEEGEATLENDRYIGKVSHFTFWNCDIPSDFIDLTGSIVDPRGGVENLLVQITNVSDGTNAFDYTNEEGVFNGFVPNDEALIITIFNACGEVIYTAPIGPFSEDTTIEPINLENTSTTINISGILEDCDANPITNGYVLVEFENGFATLVVDENGVFNSNISTCGVTTITLTGYDLDNFQQTIPATFDITGLDALDLGPINTCEDLTEYYISTIAGETFNFLEFDIDSTSSIGAEFVIFALTNNLTDGLNIAQLHMLELPPVNTPVAPDIYIGRNDEYSGGCQYNGNGTEPCYDLEVTFQSVDFENPGDVIQGTYEGQVIDSFSEEVIDVSGSFRVVKN